MSSAAAALTLLAYQKRVLHDRAKVLVVEKSRRIGITWSVGLLAVMTAAAAEGCDVWYVNTNKDDTQEFIRECAEHTRVLHGVALSVEERVIVDEGEQLLTYTIRFTSGFRVTALSSRPRRLRGKKGLIIIDEFAFNDDADETLKAALPIIMWGGRVLIISTHNGVESRFNKLCEDTRAGRHSYSLHRITFDDAVRDGLYRRICDVSGQTWSAEGEAQWVAETRADFGDYASEELDCVPSRSGGTYIPRVMIEPCMTAAAKVVRLRVPDDFVKWPEHSRVAHIDEFCTTELKPLLDKLPDDKPHFFGEDFGRLSDRTVIAPGYLGAQLKRHIPFAVELSNVPFESQKQILFYIVDRLPRLMAGALDATGNGQYLAEVAAQRYGSLVQQVWLSDPWYGEHLPPFKAAFEDDAIELPLDTDHLIDLGAFKMLNGTPKLPKARVASTTGAPRHGDAGIAYALAFFASRQEVVDYGYTAVPRNGIAHDQESPWRRASSHYAEADGKIGASWKRGGGIL